MGNEVGVTVEQVMAWSPCYSYSQEKMAALFAGRDVLSAQDIAALNISCEDRVWALLHSEFLSDKQMHEIACDFAEHVVHLCGEDARPRAAIEAKRAWLRGEITDETLASARDVARAAARDAARPAAWNAAWNAARVAEGKYQLDKILYVLEVEE